MADSLADEEHKLHAARSYSRRLARLKFDEAFLIPAALSERRLRQLPGSGRGVVAAAERAQILRNGSILGLQHAQLLQDVDRFRAVVQLLLVEEREREEQLRGLRR